MNENQNNQETEQPKKLSREERFALIFGDDANLQNGGDDVSLESANAKTEKVEPQFETVVIDGDEYDFPIERETSSEPQTFTVSEDDNEIEIDGETFRVVVSNHIHGNITLEIDGGYGLADYEDGSQDYVEIDGNYQVAVLYDDTEPALDGKEFEVTITPEMIADAKAYRANYPVDIED